MLNHLFYGLDSCRGIGVLLVVFVNRANGSGSRSGSRRRRNRSRSRSIVDDGVDSGYGRRRSEGLCLLLAAVTANSTAFDFVEFIPVIHTPILLFNIQHLNGLLTTRPTLGGIVENGRSGVVVAGCIVVFLGLEPLVTAVIGTADHSSVIFLGNRAFRRLACILEKIVINNYPA